MYDCFPGCLISSPRIFTLYLLYLQQNKAKCIDTGTRLDKYWSDQPLLYDFKAELAGTADRSKCDIEV